MVHTPLVQQLRRREPEFRRPAGAPDLSVVGTSNYAPSSVPMTLVTTLPSGSITSERLFCDQAADGSPVAYYYPGTFAPVVPAGRGWRG